MCPESLADTWFRIYCASPRQAEVIDIYEVDDAQAQAMDVVVWCATCMADDGANRADAATLAAVLDHPLPVFSDYVLRLNAPAQRHRRYDVLSLIQGNATNLDLNGHTISDTNPHTAFLSIHSNARLSISGGGTITSPHVHVIVVLGALTVRDATIVSTSGESTFAIVADESRTVDIYGGLFSSPVRPSWCASGFAPRVAPRGDPGGSGTLYTVGEQVDKPTAINRVYNGTEQYGADASAAYVLSGGGTTPGPYTTTATPAEGHAWPADASAYDGSYAQAKALSEAGAKPVELVWRMEPRPLEPSMVDARGQTYNGTPKTPVAVSCDGHALTEGTDYEVTYKNNVNAGTASYAISGKGNCTGNVEGTFAIAPADISQATFASIPSQTHTGKAITPSISGTFGGHALVPETDFTAAYADNTNVGTATVSITGTGNFTGTQKLTFNIVARDKETPRDTESGTAATSTPRTTSPSLSGASSTDTSLAKTTLAKTADVTDATYVLPSALGAAALAAYGIRSRRKDGFRGRR